jgi:hypothetical protein
VSNVASDGIVARHCVRRGEHSFHVFDFIDQRREETLDLRLQEKELELCEEQGEE